MKFDIHQPPREFSPAPGLKLKDMGDLHLDVDEQVTVRLTPTAATTWCASHGAFTSPIR